MENLEQDFRKCYRKIKKDAIISSILYPSIIFALIGLNWSTAGIGAVSILIICPILMWIQVWIIKGRIDKKWFIANDEKARKFIGSITRKPKRSDIFITFALWIGIVGAGVIIFGYFEKHSIGWVISGIMTMFGAMILLLGKGIYDKKIKAL